jgi:hypothetical protein
MPGESTCVGTDGVGLGATDAGGDAGVVPGDDGEVVADGPVEPGDTALVAPGLLAPGLVATGPDGTGPVGAGCSPGAVVPQAAVSATVTRSTISI